MLMKPTFRLFQQSSNNRRTSLYHQADLVVTLDESFQQLTSAQQVIHRPLVIRAARKPVQQIILCFHKLAKEETNTNRC